MSATESLDARLLQLVAPLQEEAEGLRTRLAELDIERHEVQADLKRIDGVLTKMFPSPKETKRLRGRPSENGRMVSDDRVEDVLRFIETHDQYKEGFIAGPLAKAMNLEGDAVGKDTVRKAVLVLHDRGVVRAVRKTVGGGTLYQLVG